MSHVSYNSIGLDLVKTNEIERTPELSTDGTTYLRTRWVHDFFALWNPEANSFNDTPRFQAGLLPSITDSNIRHHLSQPRRTYIWTVGGQQVIRSPSLGQVADMNNGPIVDVISINSMHGSRAWVIHMRITTWVNECPDAPVILAHRWRPIVDIDENQFSTRTVVGEVDFNIPKLIELSRHADEYRMNFGHPMEPYFKRESVQVAIAENGSSANYQFVDVEQPMNIGRNCPATKLEVEYRHGWTKHGVLRSVTNTFDMAAQFFSGGGGSGNTRSRFVTSGAAAALSVLPKWSELCHVKAWGNRKSKKSDLVKLAVEIAYNRIGTFQTVAGLTTSLELVIDVTGKYVEFILEHQYGVAQESFTSIFGDISKRGPTEDLKLEHIAPLPIEDVNLRSGHAIKTSEGWGNPLFNVASNETRGTWLHKLVVASLLDPCQGPSLTTNNALYTGEIKNYRQ